MPRTLLQDVELELLKAALSLTVAIVAAVLVGQYFTARWNLSQKRREMELSSANQFYLLYGEFLEIWRLWKLSGREDQTRGQERWSLLKRATAAESGVEAILVKLAIERKLSEFEIQSMGTFRQLYQMLREGIRDQKAMAWRWDDPQLHLFKEKACHVAMLLAAEPEEHPTSDNVAAAIRRLWGISSFRLRDLVSTLVAQELNRHLGDHGQWYRWQPILAPQRPEALKLVSSDPMAFYSGALVNTEWPVRVDEFYPGIDEEGARSLLPLIDSKLAAGCWSVWCEVDTADALSGAFLIATRLLRQRTDDEAQQDSSPVQR